ncbi:signal peptidase II [Archangium gephyra]|uniref:Lipoprotein signal peptidase n=1 Tax=Archangium gephyra TaxID=48 RepID=A0AAC8TCM7_9BACT|nr:signal peptidase II [Archangium gephyra]AKI99550.1 Lipoprotein signal peptidase [Archangium gephyra]REG27910.1 signal peptidase II [Archangium gephyra]
MPRKYILLLTVALGVIVLDQWTKYLVVRELTTRFDDRPTLGERLSAMYGEPPPQGFDGLHYRSKRYIEVSDSFFRLRYAENPGAAWGLFRSLPPATRGLLFHVVSIGAVVLITWYFSKLSGKDPQERWALWGLPLVLGGAIGNYIDRIARAFVIDFLEAHWYDKAAWPSFNVADSAIVVGVGLLLVDAFVRKETPDKETPKQDKSATART